jgi:transposase-like protein
MEALTPLKAAIDQVGLTQLAKACGVSHQAVRKWQRQGRLPRTEWTGETTYATAIEQATAGGVKRDLLMAKWPAPLAEPA